MKTLNKKGILVVDDSVLSLKILTDILSPRYTVRVAQRGQEALRMAQGSQPDMILLDIGLPDIDGFEVCRRLKTDILTEGVPVMFITGRSDPASEARGLSLGAVDYLQKPFVAEVVLARISNQLELKALRDGLEERVRSRTEELELVKKTTLFGMALSAEYRDQETGGHIWRTTEYVRILAQAARRLDDSLFPESDVEPIAESAALHDIGKVGIPDAILKKPGALAPEEYDIMKRHPRIGGEILARVESKLGETSFLHYAREITENHHERWDGSGYPRGISADRIPVSACLMSIADVYDALVSRRVYKEALAHGDAVGIITRGDGRTSPGHFSPLALQAFIESADAMCDIHRRISD